MSERHNVRVCLATQENNKICVAIKLGVEKEVVEGRGVFLKGNGVRYASNEMGQTIRLRVALAGGQVGRSDSVRRCRASCVEIDVLFRRLIGIMGRALKRIYVRPIINNVLLRGFDSDAVSEVNAVIILRTVGGIGSLFAFLKNCFLALGGIFLATAKGHY